MNKITSFLGICISSIAVVLLVFGGLISLIICIGIVIEVFGSSIAFLSLIVFPLLITVAPLYALVALGNWFPIAFVYGLGITITVLFYLSKFLLMEKY